MTHKRVLPDSESQASAANATLKYRSWALSDFCVRNVFIQFSIMVADLTPDRVSEDSASAPDEWLENPEVHPVASLFNTFVNGFVL